MLFRSTIHSLYSVSIHSLFYFNPLLYCIATHCFINWIFKMNWSSFRRELSMADMILSVVPSIIGAGRNGLGILVQRTKLHAFTTISFISLLVLTSKSRMLNFTQYKTLQGETKVKLDVAHCAIPRIVRRKLQNKFSPRIVGT